MATASKISVSEGQGKNTATYSVTDTDNILKEFQRIIPSDSSGAETSDPVSHVSNVADLAIHPGDDYTRNVKKIEEQWPVVVVLTGNISQTTFLNKACNLGRIVINNHGAATGAVITITDGGSTAVATITTVPGAAPLPLPYFAMLNISLVIQVTNAGTGFNATVLAS